MHTLVSFLGRGRDNPTSGYREATYHFADGTDDTTAFFGLALARHLKPDALVLLGTAGSMWDVLIENLPGIGETDEALRLELMEAVASGSVTADLLGRTQPLIERAVGRPVRLELIPFGRDAAEQRHILECIEQAAEPGEVSLDVTHGFRHLPMLSLISAFVLERLRRTVTGIYYGALEMTTGGYTPVLGLDGLLAIQRWVEALAVFAHPSDLAGGVANDEGVGLDFFGHNGSGPDEGVGPDVVTTDDGGVGTDGGTFANHSFQVFPFAVDGAARVDDVGKNHGRSQEHVVFAGDTFIDGDVVLHFHVVAEYDAAGNEYVLAEVTVFPDDGSCHDVTEVPDFTACTDLGALINDGGRMNEAGVAHAFFSFF